MPFLFVQQKNKMHSPETYPSFREMNSRRGRRRSQDRFDRTNLSSVTLPRSQLIDLTQENPHALLPEFNGGIEQLFWLRRVLEPQRNVESPYHGNEKFRKPIDISNFTYIILEDLLGGYWSRQRRRQRNQGPKQYYFFFYKQLYFTQH